MEIFDLLKRKPLIVREAPSQTFLVALFPGVLKARFVGLDCFAEVASYRRAPLVLLSKEVPLCFVPKCTRKYTA